MSRYQTYQAVAFGATVTTLIYASSHAYDNIAHPGRDAALVTVAWVNLASASLALLCLTVLAMGERHERRRASREVHLQANQVQDEQHDEDRDEHG